MADVIVLGAGMVGALIARDLADEPGVSVTAIDGSERALARLRERDGRIETVCADLAAPGAVRNAVTGYDLACGAVPGFMGFGALREVIDAGVPYCDISFMPEDPLTLDEVAQRRSVPAVVDCGVAPGLSNLLAGVAAERLAPCQRIEILVGGLPRIRRAPFQYKAAFSPIDVIEEYTRPARFVEHGEVVTRPALSGVEPVDLPGVGTLEAFNTDGLRTLMHTLAVPTMREKTLRYPGHAALMRAFRDAGFFSTEPVQVGGSRVAPRDLAAELLFPIWTYEPGEADLTVMRVTAEGAGARITWDLLDEYDPASDETSMARTTAFPCAIVAREILAGRIGQAGVIPPERLARNPGTVERVLAGLARRGITLRESSDGSG
ncbi:MAG: saccharopine dehydrogenase [Planctomycetota bacterium]|nr:MAG: saccharopine dehydrogenase [Planctomycetota bacterium]